MCLAVVAGILSQAIRVPHQACITKDNVPISIDFLVYRQVVDPISSVIAVPNFAGASQGIAAATLRAVIGDIVLDDVVVKREHQCKPPHQALRRHRALGSEGHRCRDPRDPAAAGGAGCHEPGSARAGRQ